MYKAKQHAQSEYFRDINTNNDRNKIFNMARAVKDTNKNVTEEKCVPYDKGNLTISDEAKLHAWKEHYQRLLNVEFPWDENSLNNSAAVEGPTIFVTENIVTEAIKKMKQGKAGGPSVVIVEMIKAGGRETVTAILELVNLIIYEEKIPEEWKDCFIINCYKGKSDATDRENYKGLKLLEHLMKSLERVLESLIRSQDDTNNMHFGFMLGRSITDAMYILRQIQEKHLIKKKKVYFAFVDLEKAFDRVLPSVLWWAMRKLGIDEWIVRLVKVMYDGSNSRVKVNGCFSERFEVTVGGHQGSVLSPLLFAIAMEALSRECRIGSPRELLYANDLVIMSDNLGDLKIQLQTWGTSLETRGLKINVGKTKIFGLSGEVQKPTRNVKWPCGMCSKGVGVNSLLCQT